MSSISHYPRSIDLKCVGSSVNLAPINKKPAAGSSGKLGAGLVGKSSSSVGKSSTFGSTGKSSGLLGSSGKSAKLINSNDKTASFFGASGPKDNYLGSSGKSAKISSEKSSHHFESSPKFHSIKNSTILGSTSKTGSEKSNKVFGLSGKSGSEISGKNNATLGLDKKSNNAPDLSKQYPSFITPKSNKSSAGFGIIWIPTKKHNKKKDIVYNSHNYEHYKERSPTMYHHMSGDSPDYQPHKKKEEETDLLVPERPKVTTVAVNTGITAANIDMPSDSTGPEKAEEKQEFIRRDSEETKEAAGDTNERSEKDYLENNENVANKSPENVWDKDKQGDKVDSIYLRPPPPHKTRSTISTNDDEDCGIKCLYYTLQCCDCVLM